MGYAGRTIEGNTVPLYGRFSNAAGAPTDPTTLVLRVKKPDGTLQVYRQPTPGPGELALTKESTGVWYGDYAATIPGVTYFRWEVTGAVAGADEDYLYVDPSSVV